MSGCFYSSKLIAKLVVSFSIQHANVPLSCFNSKSMRVWFHIREFIPNPKLILDEFLHIWFHIGEDFKIDFGCEIDSELKQL